MKMKAKRDWAAHDLGVMNLFGVPVAGTSKNLFQEILGMEARYLIDTNIPWERYSAMPHYLNSAFVMGPTIAREKSRTAIFENSNGIKVRNNVFIFSLWPPKEGGLVMRLAIERLDGHTLAIRKRDELRRWDDPNYRIEEYNPPEARQQEKMSILEKLGMTQMSELKETKRMHQAADNLKNSLKQKAKDSFRDFRKCIDVAERAYGILLADSQSALNEFRQSDPHDRNVFGDTEVIQNALFFGATVLSTNHKHVGKMAEYCGLDYRTSLG